MIYSPAAVDHNKGAGSHPAASVKLRDYFVAPFQDCMFCSCVSGREEGECTVELSVRVAGGMPFGGALISCFRPETSRANRAVSTATAVSPTDAVAHMHDKSTCTRDLMQSLESSERQANTGIISIATPCMEHTHKDIEPFDEQRDDVEVVRALFDMIDIDKDGKISSMEMNLALQKFRDAKRNDSLITSLQRLIDELPAGTKNGGLKFEEFSKVFGQLPRVRGERVHWAGTLCLDMELARYLKMGDAFDGLRGLTEMTENELQEHISEVCDQFARRLPWLLQAGLDKLRNGQAKASPTAEDANHKFATTTGAFKGKFATLKHFYKGPEGLVGHPNSKLLEGMQREHCQRSSSKRFFIAPNYAVHTTTEWEWYWLMNPDPNSPELPEDLKQRLHQTGKYPGDVGDVLKESEFLVTIKKKLDPAQLTCIQEDLVVRLEALKFEDFQHIRGMRIVKAAAVLNIDVGYSGGHVEMTIAIPCSESKLSALLISDISKHVQQAASVAEGEVEVVQVAQRIVEYCHDVQDREHELTLAFSKKDIQELEGEITTVMLAPIAEGLSTAKHKEACILSLVGHFHKHHKQGRHRNGAFADFLKSDEIVKKQNDFRGLERLLNEEVMAQRLYTGPNYMVYNAVLRGFPSSIVKMLDEGNEINSFSTTIFVICSGINKLSRLTKVPENRLLYRGLGGILLPDEFWKETDQQFKGGVEFGIMSTTANKNVAIEYSGVKMKRGIVLEVTAGGRIDIGASISFLSEYPGEEEYLMPPLSCMEVVGKPRLDKTDFGEVLLLLSFEDLAGKTYNTKIISFDKSKHVLR